VDVVAAYFSRTGKYRVIATSEDARTRIKVTEVATNKAVDLPKLPDGDITAVTVSDGETQMAFYHKGPRSPNNLFVYDFGTRKAKKLAESLSHGD
jgi:dipeptidyl aminopeptidase/acylaminoacyl peptidase